MQAEDLNDYRLCDNVWTISLSDVKFDLKDGQGLIEVDKVKIVAADVDGEDLVLQLLFFFFFIFSFIIFFYYSYSPNKWSLINNTVYHFTIFFELSESWFLFK